ncbi:POL4 DNA polymerase IV [Pyrenophora teres f. maculata]|nr:POL4 DNA polymerase IV [Pyrenophora teres f. maculata]
MSRGKLAAKEAYFDAHGLLSLEDDDDVPNESLQILENALEETRPKIRKPTGSFLGPTPKEKQAEFEAYAKRQAEWEAFTRRGRGTKRQTSQDPVLPSTAPEPELTTSFPTTKPRSGVAAKGKGKLKRTSSLTEIPFWKQVGVVPRELKHRKAKPVQNIELYPPHKQLFRDKIVYFYPNDDISVARRRRIHKVIQLGAAWVTSWRDDITHIIIDDATYKCKYMMKHLNRTYIPEHIVLVIFDPYVPDSIQFGKLQDPKAQRFMIEDAPSRHDPSEVAEPSQISAASQTSLRIKLSTRQIAAQDSQQADSHLTEETIPSPLAVPQASSKIFEDTVLDSFIVPSPAQTEAPQPKVAEDAFTRAIQEAKALAHLPLDEDEDADSPLASGIDDAEHSGTDEEPPVALRPTKLTKFLSKASALRDKKDINMNAFQCIDPGANGYNSQNPNARTIQILEEMCRHYDQMQDHWRSLSYRKCINTLKKQTVKITTAKQAIALPFIGSRLADKIEEIVLTDRLRRLDSTRDDPLDKILRLFLGIYGAGLFQANKWIQAGYHTLSDLETKAKLTPSQKIGLEHYDDFNSRIPRAEVEAHGAVVIAALKKIDTNFKATIMGSYRRGAKDSGDIDMIITCPDTSLAAMRTTVFEVLVPHLYKTGFLKASLATSRSSDPAGSKWHGASCLPKSTVWRRMDLLLVPEEEMGAALIYFTGDDIFNRSMRLLARKMGMRLNQRGLYKDVKRGARGEKLNEGVLVEGRNEKKIFEILGVPWREPHERIC